MAKNRIRQRRNKREDKLNSKNEYGIPDPTPKRAIEKMRMDHSNN